MKKLVILVFIAMLSMVTVSQEPNSEIAKKTSEKAVEEATTGGEEEEFNNAISQPFAAERITALKKFIGDFPESKKMLRAKEIIVGSRAELADEKLRFGENDEGIRLFKLAVEEAPTPVSDKLFSGLLIKFPTNIFIRGQREAAVEVAEMIEERVAENPKQLLGLATFYLGTENASGAMRVAEKSIKLEPESAAAYYAIGFAHRINFDLKQAADAYSRALRFEPESVASKMGLADMKRALGEAEKAAPIYREVLEKDAANLGAQTGLVLSLFDSGSKDEAEAEMKKSLEVNPKNLTLLVGAAYWYAAHKDGVKAVELAQQALAFETRYTWTYIAMARGYLQQGDPLTAERTLLIARQFGKFPTLEYELATTRAEAGFYKEAAEGLKESFSLENGLVKTKLGGRIEKESESFIDLLAPERRASILQVQAADDDKNSDRLKNLLYFFQILESKDLEVTEIESAADKFIAGDDNMKFHRQLFVANQLLENKKALPKVLEITKDSVAGVDDAFNVNAPSAAVLADELYDRRKIALTRGENIVVPEISPLTLSRIVRGRIEELSGWTLFQQDKPEEAVSKLKLAISVLPKDSAWSRSTMWKLGTVLHSQGKIKEALDSYINGYVVEAPNPAKKLVIENLYANVNGNLYGLEQRLQQKSSGDETISIFTNKSLATQQEDVEPVKDETKSVTDTEKSTDPTINSERVPSSVPIAKATPVETPRKISEESVANKLDESATKPSPVDEKNTKTDEKTPAASIDKKKIPDEISTSKVESTDVVLRIPEDPVPNKSDESATKPNPVDEKHTKTDENPSEEIKAIAIDEKTPAASIDKKKIADEISTSKVASTDNVLRIPADPTVGKPDETSDGKTAKPLPDADSSIIDKILEANSNINKLPLIGDDIGKVNEDEKNAGSQTDSKAESLLKPTNALPNRERVVKTDAADPPSIEKLDLTRNDVPESSDKTGNDKTPADATEKPATDVNNKSETKVDKIPTDPVVKPKTEVDNSIPEDETNKKDESVSPKVDDKGPKSGLGRPRLVAEDKIKNADSTPETQACQVLVSHDVISIKNDGGAKVILVDFEEAKKIGIKKIKTLSASPEDVEVLFEPKISELSGKIFFEVKSISTNKGLFMVTIETPCGKKDVWVEVL